MADATPGVTAAEKSPERIERDMEQTRESITAKVSALENQVLGTIQTATTTISDTVQAVKDTVTTAPTAVKETIQESVAAVKDSVKETFASVKESVAAFDVNECVGRHPAAWLGGSVATGFVTGFLLFGGKDTRSLMARGYREPAPDGRPGAPNHDHTSFGTAGFHAPPARPGLFANLWSMVGGEVEQLAKQALSTALASLKQSVNEQVPRLVDGAVQNVADRVSGHNGATHGGPVQPDCRPRGRVVVLRRAGGGGEPMRWIGLLCVVLGAVVLGANAFGDRTEAAAGGPVVGGIVVVAGLLLLVGRGRAD